MKKRIFCISLCVLIIFLTAFSLKIDSVARASSPYLRVITEQTPFYKNHDDIEPLFFLPYTYYVKVIGTEGTFLRVECYGDGNTATIDGYVPIGYLFDDGLYVSSPYVVLDLTTSATAVLYADSTLKNPTQYIFANRTLHYYGGLPYDNGMIYYVEYNGRLGYVKEAEVFPFSIPNHPNELTFLPSEETPPESEQPKDSPTSAFDLRVVIIACLIFAGLVALFFVLGKNKSTRVAVSFYDENDYE